MSKDDKAGEGSQIELLQSKRFQFTHHVTPYHYKKHVEPSQHNNPSNKRRSTRYTWWNFFPIALAIQFTKVVNIFYCVTAIMQCIPEIQTNSPLATVVPLCFVISLGILKELIAEVKRYKEDKAVNNAPVMKLNRDGLWVPSTLAATAVGDIIKVHDFEMVPADCILLQTDSETNEAFVKTAALDGERNLKPKMAIKQLAAVYEDVIAKPDAEKCPFMVECIPALKDMYTFEGRIGVNAEGKAEPEWYTLDLNQFLHRGCFVENSNFVIALVVHTGVESKLIMNLGQYRFKKSRFESVLNYVLVFNLCLALLLSTIASFQNAWWTEGHIVEHQYVYEKLDVKTGSTLSSIKAFFSFYLIVNSFVPLDLLVALEISKLVYTPYMEQDGEMMVPDYVVNEVKGMECHSLSLHEELGLVQYIFCDKTGTLTQNELVFRQLAMPDGGLYDYTGKPFKDMKQDIGSSKTTADFFNCIALCNDCISVKDGDKITYNGPSVDEVCLLEMALEANIGYFVDRDSSHVRVQTPEGLHSFALLRTHKFDSMRKCMSVIVKSEQDNKTYSFVKGADSSVFPLCTATDKNIIDTCEKAVEQMAMKGLRTLCYGMKEFDLAGRDPMDIEPAECESNLHLLAATAVEDLLQENVKECIEDFRAAGISVWMLTGDKGLTAREIGVSCGLVPNNAETFSPDEKTAGDTTGFGDASERNNVVFDYEETLTDPTVIFDKTNQFNEASKNYKMYTVLISGITMQKVLDNEFIHEAAAKLLLGAESVVMFRSSPSQKAEVVLFMRKATGGKVTVAIGDGANDVNMIQQAHIGFGLMGKEGNQAASFADYAVPRYKDLRRALFWHGRNYGNRMINLVCFCLFKSMINATTKYCMQFENGFSGQQPVDGLLLSLYNVTMTVWFMFGCSYLDQDVSNRKYGRDESKMPYTMSEAYIYGRTYQSRIGFCKLILWKDAYSLICGFIIYYAFYFGQGSMGFAGKMFGLWSYGVFATVACVVIHHVECAMYCRNWDINLVAWFTLSICLLPLTCLGQNFIPKSDLFRCIYWQILGSARILSMLVFAICSVSMPLYAYKSWYQVIQYPKFYTQD